VFNSCNEIYNPNEYLKRLEKRIGKPRYSRRKRQMKKNIKKWKKTNAYLCAILIQPLRRSIGYSDLMKQALTISEMENEET
jgi:hypothetical protein